MLYLEKLIKVFNFFVLFLGESLRIAAHPSRPLNFRFHRYDFNFFLQFSTHHIVQRPFCSIAPCPQPLKRKHRSICLPARSSFGLTSRKRQWSYVRQLLRKPSENIASKLPEFRWQHQSEFSFSYDVESSKGSTEWWKRLKCESIKSQVHRVYHLQVLKQVCVLFLNLWPEDILRYCNRVRSNTLICVI